ncbi:hypothetical protein B0H15DRAFT_991076 [Mycena belliarum]|uniref:Uncharacterized protein n=1 Tax=Mycena belliarum TaxID=1033014 RepID=A0AAD6UJM8_9AGAR|nr:hypothetical protein B0H15DRAFT_991076 [Mycena belliae]
MRADGASHVHRRAARSVHRLVARGDGESHGHVLYPGGLLPPPDARVAHAAASARTPPSPHSRRRSRGMRHSFRRANRRVLEASEAGTAVCASQTRSLASAAVLESARAAASPTPPRSDAGSGAQLRADTTLAPLALPRSGHATQVPAQAHTACPTLKVTRRRYCGMRGMWRQRLLGHRSTLKSVRAASARTPPGPCSRSPDMPTLTAQTPAEPRDARGRARRWGSHSTLPGAAIPVSVCGVARTCASRPVASSETIAFFSVRTGKQAKVRLTGTRHSSGSPHRRPEPR